MAVLVIQDKPAATAVNDAAAVATLSTAPTAGTGRYLIAMGHSPSANAVFGWAAMGFTAFTGAKAVDFDGRPVEFAYRKIQTGDGTTYSLEAEDPDPLIVSDTTELHLWEVSGLDEAALLNAVALAPAAANTTVSSVTPNTLAVTATDGALVFAAAGLGGTTGGGETITGVGGTTWSSPTAGSAAHTRAVVGYRIVTAPTTGIQPTISWTTPRKATGLSIALKAAAPAAVTPPYVVYRKQADGTWKTHEWRVVK